MMMSLIALILLTVCITGDRQYSARQYDQRPRGQMGYAQKGGFGSVNYGNPANAQQPEFGSVPPSNTDEPAISSTENTESTTSFGSTSSTSSTSATESTEEPVANPTSNTDQEAEEGDDIDYTSNTNEPFEISTSNIQNEEIMNCLYDKCAESFNACFNDEQCKAFMTKWQENRSLSPECLPAIPSSDTNESPKKEEFEEGAFATTEGANFESTSNTESTTSNTENTYDGTETLYSSTDADVFDDEQEPFGSTSECGYNELFWNAYNCGVANYCYADQLKLAQSHQYLLSPSNSYGSNTGSNGSKSSSSNDWTLLMVAVTAGIAAIIIYEVARRLYIAFQDKIQCQCQCLALNNSWRYLKNKWEQIGGYKYEKTHDDLDVIEESDDAEMYGRASDKDEAITNKDTIGVTYNGPLNDDSDASDDEELQKASSRAMSLKEQTDDDKDTIDDQFVHNELTVTEELIAGKDIDEEQEITKEPAQEL